VTAELTLPRRTRDFYAIAHRAGNNLHHLEQALKAGVDAIECDMWHYHGKLALRHERKLPALPVLYDRWYVRWSWGVVKLRELLRTVDFRAELFLDIKSSTPRAADAVLDLYHDNEAMLPRTLVSSQRWGVLDRIALAGTGMQMFYSVGREKAVEALLARAAKEPRPAGTSIRHTLLSADRVRRLHDAGLRVYAWTVNNPHRADELRQMGVDGIIADNFEVFSEHDLKDGAGTRDGAPRPG
jgi:glycerophosphoryl diester phosphodiesterase